MKKNQGKDLWDIKQFSIPVIGVPKTKSEEKKSTAEDQNSV